MKPRPVRRVPPNDSDFDPDGDDSRGPDTDVGFDRGTALDSDSLERRLEAVERALSGDEPLERTDRLDDLETRVVELEAAVQALRGYVGSVRAVNEDVERRADRAFRKARAVERSFVLLDLDSDCQK